MTISSRLMSLYFDHLVGAICCLRWLPGPRNKVSGIRGLLNWSPRLSVSINTNIHSNIIINHSVISILTLQLQSFCRILSCAVKLELFCRMHATLRRNPLKRKTGTPLPAIFVTAQFMSVFKKTSCMVGRCRSRVWLHTMPHLVSSLDEKWGANCLLRNAETQELNGDLVLVFSMQRWRVGGSMGI